MFNFYIFEPNDTVFFRGSEPMNIGEHHDATLNFPPPIHTIAGAIRTYFFKKDKKKYEKLINIGEEKPGFNIVGPFFKLNDKVYLPAPYLWFKEKNKTKHNSDSDEKVKIIKAKKIKEELIKSFSKDLYWAKGDSELESIGGNWIAYDDLFGKTEVVLKKIDEFYDTEPRVGIALNPDRSVRVHHIYSFTHCRLKKGVSLVFGIDIEELGDEGVLFLGAEQRFGRYKKENFNLDLNKQGQYYMSLSLISGSSETNEVVVATGKIVYLGGWDLYKGFHKPMKGYFPAGTVFNKKIENCIAID